MAGNVVVHRLEALRMERWWLIARDIGIVHCLVTWWLITLRCGVLLVGEVVAHCLDMCCSLFKDVMAHCLEIW